MVKIQHLEAEKSQPSSNGEVIRQNDLHREDNVDERPKPSPNQAEKIIDMKAQLEKDMKAQIEKTTRDFKGKTSRTMINLVLRTNSHLSQ